MRNRGITKIEGLDDYVNLEILVLSHNKIDKIEGLDNLVNLKELYLDENNITKIEGLDTLTKLRRLVLSDNKITKVEGLNTQLDLDDIALYGNNITEIHGMDNLDKLDSWKMDFGKIKFLSTTNLMIINFYNTPAFRRLEVDIDCRTLKALYHSYYEYYNIKDISKWEKQRRVTITNKKLQHDSKEIARKLLKYDQEMRILKYQTKGLKTNMDKYFRKEIQNETGMNYLK